MSNRSGTEKAYGIAETWAVRALMISFLLPAHLQVWVAMPACLLLWLGAWRAGVRPSSRQYILATLLALPALVYVCALPFTAGSDAKALLSLCEQRMSLLLAPFAFVLISPFAGSLLLRELKWFACGAVGFTMVANVAFVYHCAKGSVDVQQLSHVDYRTFMHNFTGLHPTYLSMYLCFGAAILLLESGCSAVVKRVFPLAAVFLLLLLGAKAVIAALMLILLHQGWLHRHSLRRLAALFAGVVLSVGIAWYFLPFFRQRFAETTGLFGGNAPQQITDNSVYVRKLIWNTDMEILHQYWITGTGPARLTPLLKQHYAAYAKVHPLPVSYYDPHNAYLVEWLSFGLAGIAIFAGIMAMHFARAIRNRDRLYLYLLFIFSIVSFTESVLSVQRGVMFFSLFLAMFFFMSRPGEQRS